MARMQIVEGGGFRLLTDDQILISVVRRCAQLEAQLREARFRETARFRTLRRDVASIKKHVRTLAPTGVSGGVDNG